jgi:hypothetical protein
MFVYAIILFFGVEQSFEYLVYLHTVIVRIVSSR